MKIAALYARPEPTISFEFFPPKSEDAEAALFANTLPELKKLGPSFISVTYGAGGGTRGTTLRVVDRVRREFGIEAMAHLTCSGSTREMLASVLDDAHSLGIENILALRGDPPRGEAEFKPTEGGFTHAVHLISFIKSLNRFGVGAACYPEGHIECPDRKLDWDRAAAKVEAGAEFLITQLFYNCDDFLAMEDYLRNKRGVKVPIVPGVLPFLNTAQIKRFCSLCGSKLPDAIVRRLEELGDDDESVRQFGVDYCSKLCRQLLDHGVPGIHFYCLNRSLSCKEIIHNLGLAPMR